MSKVASSLVRVSDVYLLIAERQGFTNHTPISDNSLIVRVAGTERKSESGDKLVNDYHFFVAEDDGRTKLSRNIPFIKDVVEPIDEDFVSMMDLRNPKNGSVGPGLIDVDSIAKFNSVRFDFDSYDYLDFRDHNPEKIYPEECKVDNGVPATETLQSVIDRIKFKEDLFNAPTRREKEAHFDRVADVCHSLGVGINAPGVITVLMAHCLVSNKDDVTTDNIRRAIGYLALMGEITDRSE